MAHKQIKGKQFVWHHVPVYTERDLEFLQSNFKFHPLDFDDIREMAELPKLDVYKYYLFCIFAIPYYDVQKDKIEKTELAVFLSADSVVTVSHERIPAIDRYFVRAQKSNGLKRDALGKSTGYFLYRLLDYAFREAKSVLKILSRETHVLEEALHANHKKTTTKRLGTLRRNLLFFRHIIDPQRIIITQIAYANKAFISKDLDVYFDDLKDTLDGMWVVSDNLKNIVDGMFDVNEALLSHRTNEIIRLLTVISVILMPPTLIASYYGMNVGGLPYAESIWIVSGILFSSLLLFWILILLIDRKK